MTVIGARPQFIKAAATGAALARHGIEEMLVLTGQHVDERMAARFVGEFALRPVHTLASLDVAPGTDRREAMQAQLEPLLRRHAPDAVLVYGDTDSTLAGARAANACATRLVHVEAGLRSFNEAMREEYNRVQTDALADLLFAPSTIARDRLLAEGVQAERVKLVGDVMLDLFMRVSRELRLVGNVRESNATRGGVPHVLLTAHRAENVDDHARLEVLVAALERLSGRVAVLWPLHPRTRKRLVAANLLARTERAGVRIVDPLSYESTVAAVLDSDVVCTDSGGLQKEAFFGGIPCVTIRPETEWTELVDAGWNRLCPLDGPAAIAQAILDAVGTRGEPIRPYGEGHASESIASEMARWLDVGRSLEEMPA